MVLIPKDFVPRPSEWFSPELEYAGRCRAEFAAPCGSIEGPATVAVDGTGRVGVRMLPEAGSLDTGGPTPYGMEGFLGGEGYAREVSPGWTRIDPEARNPCTKLEVVTPRGVFVTDDVSYCGTNSFMGTGEVTEANFAVGMSRFEATPQAAPAYWALPLANFLTECWQAHPDLDRHPLRVFPKPELPEEVTSVLSGQDHELSSEKALQCWMAAHSKRRPTARTD